MRLAMLVMSESPRKRARDFVIRTCNPDTEVCMQAGEEPAVLQAAAGGNMHAFTAVSSCAVLDLLAPPYDTSDRTHSQLPVTCRKD